jgi:Zn-dependent protease
VLLTWSLARGWFALGFAGWSTSTSWIAAFISALLLFVCVLAHELAHALVARTHGLTVKHITLFLFGGGTHGGRDGASRSRVSNRGRRPCHEPAHGVRRFPLG